MHQIFQQARDERGFTNAQIARALSVSESYVSKIMSGARSPAELLDDLCKLLGIEKPAEERPKRKKAS